VVRERVEAVEEAPWGCGQAVEAWSGGAVGEIWRRDAVELWKWKQNSE